MSPISDKIKQWIFKLHDEDRSSRYIANKLGINKTTVLRHVNSDFRERMNKKNVERKRRKKYKVLSHYSNGKLQCKCCEESIYEFLTIDHEKGGGRKHKLAVGDVYGDLIRNNFPKGYRVLCMNCNFGREYNNGVCPHKVYK